MALDEDFILPHNYLRMPTPVTRNHRPWLTQGSSPENIPSFPDLQSPWHTNPMHHDPSVLDSAHAFRMQMPHNLGLWGPSDVQASFCAYNPGRNATHCGSHTTFDPPMTLWPTPLDQQNGTLWHHLLDQSSVHPSYACSSHATRSHYPSSANDKNITELSIPHYSPPYQSFSPISPHFYPHPHPTSTGFVETVPRSLFPFYRAPHSESTRSSRRRRCARAIEYDGLWIDEEELLNGLTEPSGKFDVLQCRLEEERSPCHLWIKGDKSCINAHIQKWHGGKRGGDKLQVDCRWSACGKKMLKESIARHIVTIHLGEMWECQGCGKEVVRNDTYGRHAARSNFEACRTSDALITYSADARVIDARAALDNAGRVMYAGA